MAGDVLRKSTRGRYTSATRTREKGNTQKAPHRALGSPWAGSRIGSRGKGGRGPGGGGGGALPSHVFGMAPTVCGESGPVQMFAVFSGPLIPAGTGGAATGACFLPPMRFPEGAGLGVGSPHPDSSTTPPRFIFENRTGGWTRAPGTDSSLDAAHPPPHPFPPSPPSLTMLQNCRQQFGLHKLAIFPK